jgi:hypothetical protein
MNTSTSRALKKLLTIIAVVLGSIGTIVCIALTIILCHVSARLDRATERVFDGIDRSFVAVHQRLIQTRDHLAAAAITSAEIEESLRDWTKRETGQRLSTRLNAEERSQQLASALEQADHWLEFAESFAGLIQRMTSVDASTGATWIDPLVEEIVALRAQSRAAREFVSAIRNRIAGTNDEQSLGERIEQAAQVCLRLVATVGSLTSRLEKLVDRLPATQGQFQSLKSETQWWISVCTIGGTLLLILMAAGQVALCRLAWNGWIRNARGAKAV